MSEKRAARYASQPSIDLRGMSGSAGYGDMNRMSALFGVRPGTNIMQAALAGQQNPNQARNLHIPRFDPATADGIMSAAQKVADYSFRSGVSAEKSATVINWLESMVAVATGLGKRAEVTVGTGNAGGQAAQAQPNEQQQMPNRPGQTFMAGASGTSLGGMNAQNAMQTGLGVGFGGVQRGNPVAAQVRANWAGLAPGTPAPSTSARYIKIAQSFMAPGPAGLPPQGSAVQAQPPGPPGMSQAPPGMPPPPPPGMPPGMPPGGGPAQPPPPPGMPGGPPPTAPMSDPPPMPLPSNPRPAPPSPKSSQQAQGEADMLGLMEAKQHAEMALSPNDAQRNLQAQAFAADAKMADANDLVVGADYGDPTQDRRVRRAWEWGTMNSSAQHDASKWFPRYFANKHTPLTELLSSPGKGGLLGGLVGAGVGGLAGGVGGHLAGLSPSMVTSLALGGAGAGSALGGMRGYSKRREHNDAVMDALRHLPPGATVGDMQNFSDKLGHFKSGFRIEKAANLADMARLGLLSGGVGATQGAAVGSLLGTGAGYARGNVPEGLGRGILRGGLSGAGAGVGGLLGTLLAQRLGAAPDLGALAGASLGGVGGYLGSGRLLGPPAARREEEEKQGHFKSGFRIEKAAAQDNAKPQRSATGESEGLTFQHKPDHYVHGQEAWASADAYFHKKPKTPNPFQGRHSGEKKAEARLSSALLRHLPLEAALWGGIGAGAGGIEGPSGHRLESAARSGLRTAGVVGTGLTSMAGAAGAAEQLLPHLPKVEDRWGLLSRLGIGGAGLLMGLGGGYAGGKGMDTMMGAPSWQKAGIDMKQILARITGDVAQRAGGLIDKLKTLGQGPPLPMNSPGIDAHPGPIPFAGATPTASPLSKSLQVGVPLVLGGMGGLGVGHLLHKLHHSPSSKRKKESAWHPLEKSAQAALAKGLGEGAEHMGPGFWRSAYNAGRRMFGGAAEEAGQASRGAAHGPIYVNPVGQAAHSLPQVAQGRWYDPAARAWSTGQMGRIGQQVAPSAIGAGLGGWAGADMNLPGENIDVAGFKFNPTGMAMGAAAFNPRLREALRGSVGEVPLNSIRGATVGNFAGLGLDQLAGAAGFDSDHRFGRLGGYLGAGVGGARGLGAWGRGRYAPAPEAIAALERAGMAPGRAFNAALDQSGNRGLYDAATGLYRGTNMGMGQLNRFGSGAGEGFMNTLTYPFRRMWAGARYGGQTFEEAAARNLGGRNAEEIAQTMMGKARQAGTELNPQQALAKANQALESFRGRYNPSLFNEAARGMGRGGSAIPETVGRALGVATPIGLLGGGAYALGSNWMTNKAKDVGAQIYNEAMPQFQSDMANFADQYMQQRGMMTPQGQFNPLGGLFAQGGPLSGLSQGADSILASLGMDPSRMSGLQKTMLLGGGLLGAGGAASGHPLLAAGGGLAAVGGLLPYLTLAGSQGGAPYGGQPSPSGGQQLGYGGLQIAPPPNTPVSRNEWERQQQLNQPRQG